MRDLAAQVTGGLLRFPEVTIDALGEDEVTLDSVLRGKFTVGKSGLAWLACGPQLEVVHAVTGERFSAYRFSGVSENPPTVLTMSDFCWLKRTGLLIGLQEAEGSMLCLYDLGISRVVKAVVIPGRITAIEPLVSYGGASASTQHLHQSLRWFFGVAAVVTDIGHVLLVDLCLDDLSCSQSELEASDLEVVNKSPSEIPRLREGVTQQGRHLCLQLNSPSGMAVTALQYIHRTNQLAVGFSDGNLQLWNMKTLKKEYHSQLEGGRVPVYAFTFQEPENDPRNCCYLWAVQSAQNLEGDVVSLHLLQLAFGERKCLSSGKIIYEGLEYCEERYSQDLNGAAFPLRAQATNTRLISCQTIEKFRHHHDRDDSLNEVASPDTSVSVFTWQVKSFGQGRPSTFIAVFDINRWYHAQMPDSLRAGESLRNCPYLAVWTLDCVMEMPSVCALLDIVIHERSLSRGLPYTSPPPEQFFNPTTYNFDGSCLLNSGIVHFSCSGYQKETLTYLKHVAPSLGNSISNGYSRCLMSGLVSSRLADVQPSSLSQEEQFDAILCTAVETSSLGLVTGCIKQWTSEEQPGSAINLRYVLEWAWNKVVHTKEELDDICAPLFDSTANFIDPQTLQLLQNSQRLLANLSTIFHCLLNEAQELTQKGLIGLMNKCMVSSLISQYAQVVLWFCRTGLLPEGSDEDDVIQMARPFYGHSIIKNYYTAQREELQRRAKDKWCGDCLMIDGLVSYCGERLTELWKRDSGGTGQYPPPSLHALLDIFLLENVEESAKHAIVIYLLLDVMYSMPNKRGALVESFPTAFAIPIGLVKLVQGLWLLDHHDHESSLELLLHPATTQSVWNWQHERVLHALMCQQKESIALRYLHVMKPPCHTTSLAKLCLSVLLHNRCIVEAWSLLRQHSNKLNMEEVMRFLFETCQELGLIKELLKLPLGPAEQECLERFLQSTGGFQNRELLMVHYLQQANYVPALQLNQALKLNTAADWDPKMKERSNTRNSILNQYGKVLPRVQRKLAIDRAKPYQHPATLHREVKRPQPLSTVAKRSVSESVMTRAAFINNVLSKIEEVCVNKNATPESSPLKSPKSSETQVPSRLPSTPDLSEAFVGTPINMLTKRMSRLLDLVVQPSSQNFEEVSNLPRTPARSIASWAAPKSSSKAPELSLLHTPQVVKRARALASGPVLSAFTPQSILRSSLRPTPVATPSASSARSITPPLRTKENRITFIEEDESLEVSKESIHWADEVSIKKDFNTLKRSSPPPKVAVEIMSEHSDAEEQEVVDLERPYMIPLEDGGNLDFESETGSSVKESPEHKQVLPSLERRPSLGQETSVTSNQSDTTLEFHDAPASEDLIQTLKEQQENSDVDAEVVVRLQNVLEGDVQTAPDPLTDELPSVTFPERDTEEDLSSELNILDTEEELEMHEQEVEACVTNENIVVEEPIQEEIEEISEAQVLNPEMSTEQEIALSVQEPDVASVDEDPGEVEMQEPADESGHTSSIFDKALNLPLVLEFENQCLMENAAEALNHPPALELENQCLMEHAAEALNHPPALELENQCLMENAAEALNHPPALELENQCLMENAAEALNHPPALELENQCLVENAASDTMNEQADLMVLEMAPGEASVQKDSLVEVGNHQPTNSEPEMAEECEEETMETSDLDAFVEQHLFGPDRSPLRSQSSTKEASETSVKSDYKDVQSTSENEADLKMQSSETATSESRSVVSLNDTEELSSAASEEESEGEEESVEDSGSDVEIIDEVQGNGRTNHQPSPVLYMEELPPHDQYIQDESNAVLSLITPEAQLKVLDSDSPEDDGDVVMVGLDPADMNEGGAVCYTELRPSTTLLVQAELAEDEQTDLLVGGDLETIGISPKDTPPDVSDGFSLVLDPEMEEQLDDSELDTNAVLMPLVEPEKPQEDQNKLIVNSEVLLLEPLDITSEEMNSVKELVLDTEYTGSGSLEKEQAKDVLQTVREMVTAEAAFSDDQTDCFANGEEPESCPPERLEESNFPVILEVSGPSPPDNILTSEEVLDEVNDDVLDAEVSTFTEDNGTSSTIINTPRDSTPSLIEDVEEISTTKISSRPKSPGRPKSPARTKVERSVKDEVSENLKEVTQSPSRRTRKTVTFPLPNLEVVKDLTEEEEQMDSQVPSTPRRVTRSSKQLLDSQGPVTPRRSTKKADVEQNTDINVDLDSEKVSRTATPARRTPQKCTPKKGSQRTRSTALNDHEEIEKTETVVNEKITFSVPETPQEVSEERVQPAKVRSPGRVTRMSTRGLALGSYQQDPIEDSTACQPLRTPPRSRRKTAGSTVEKPTNVTSVTDDAQLQSVSRRLTRSRHWNQVEDLSKERSLLIPQNVHPENLQPKTVLEDLTKEETSDENVPVVSEIIRAKRRTTRSAAPLANEIQTVSFEDSKSLPDETEELSIKSLMSSRRTRASKVSENKSEPEPLVSEQRLTRGKKKETTSQTEVPKIVLEVQNLEDDPLSKGDNGSADDVPAETEVVQLRKKRTTKTKAAAEVPPPVEINFISPLTSPAESITKTKKRSEEKEMPSLRMNLRRKRMMDAIFPKPVTRRKKL